MYEVIFLHYPYTTIMGSIQKKKKKRFLKGLKLKVAQKNETGGNVSPVIGAWLMIPKKKDCENKRRNIISNHLHTYHKT